MGIINNCCAPKEKSPEDEMLQKNTAQTTFIKQTCNSQISPLDLLNQNSNSNKNLKHILKIQAIFRMHLAKTTFSRIINNKKKEIFEELISLKLDYDIIDTFRPEILSRQLISEKKLAPYNLTDSYKNYLKKKSKFSFSIQEPVKVSNKEIYIGDWNINKNYHGYGVLYQKNISKLEGIWNNGVLKGFGRLFQNNNEYYIGNFSNSLPNGEGTFYQSDDSKYIGNFSNGFPNGNGKQIFSDGSFFQGCFMNGKKIYGKFEWKDGNFYQGGIEDDLFNGQGIYEWGGKKKYNGSWKKGKMHGEGKLTFNDGSYYEGSFVEGKREGFGKYVWNKDKYYIGDWKGGKQNGQGEYYKKGKCSRGIWLNGNMITPSNKNKSPITDKASYGSGGFLFHNNSMLMSSLDVGSDDQKSTRRVPIDKEFIGKNNDFNSNNK